IGSSLSRTLSQTKTARFSGSLKRYSNSRSPSALTRTEPFFKRGADLFPEESRSRALRAESLCDGSLFHLEVASERREGEWERLAAVCREFLPFIVDEGADDREIVVGAE